MEDDGMLHGLRALDLADEKGLLCGKILADLGAEVVKVERPGGDAARNSGPFYGDSPDPEKSLYWFAFNAGKKGITLNLQAKEGSQIFKELSQKADFIIECFPPGEFDSLGLGYQVVSQLNPRIVFTSITPFGQDGPYKDYKTSDLVSMALGGYMYLCGDPDRSPVRISFPQAYVLAGAEAAAGTLMAHYHRQRTGEGQWVDVSVQGAVFPSTSNAVPFWECQGVVLKRRGQLRPGMSAGATPRQVWACKDGYVCYLLTGGATHGPPHRRLVAWMDSEGLADEFIKGVDWDKLDMSTVQQSFIDRCEVSVSRFFLAHTKAELQEGALKRGIDLYMVSTVEDVANSVQLRERNFWEGVEYPELAATIRHPGAFVKASESPLGIRRRAPLIGEHNREIYSEWLDMSPKEFALYQDRGII